MAQGTVKSFDPDTGFGFTATPGPKGTQADQVRAL